MQIRLYICSSPHYKCMTAFIYNNEKVLSWLWEEGMCVWKSYLLSTNEYLCMRGRGIISWTFSASTRKWHHDRLWMPLHFATALRLLRLEFAIRWTAKHLTAHTVLVISCSRVDKVYKYNSTRWRSINTQHLVWISACVLNTHVSVQWVLFHSLLSSFFLLSLSRSKHTGVDTPVVFIC